MTAAGHATPAEAVAQEVAAILLEEEAVLVQPDRPFTFASGIVSPVYCDLRLLMGSPASRKRIAGFLAQRIAAIGQEERVDVVGGVATAGIPWAAWAAAEAGLPMAYIREAAKGHGRGQQVEGGVRRGSSVIVIEDLTSTGASAVTAVEGLRAIGARAPWVLSIMTYESPAALRNFSAAWVQHRSLCGIRTVLKVAEEQERISPEQEETVRRWLDTGPMSR